MPDDVLVRPFSRTPIPVTLGGRLYEVPYRSALDWLNLLETTAMDGLVLMCVGDEDRWRIHDALLDGEITVPELASASCTVLRRITGYSRWWIGYRIAEATLSPEILGQLTLAGVRPETVGLPQWCAATYALLTRNASAEDRFKLDAQLDVPLSGTDPGAAWDDMGMSAAEMEAMARRMPGMG